MASRFSGGADAAGHGSGFHFLGTEGEGESAAFGYQVVVVALVGAAGEADTVGHRVKLRFGVGDHVAPEALAVDRRVLANRVDVDGHTSIMV